jgi:hypothetical protein
MVATTALEIRQAASATTASTSISILASFTHLSTLIPTHTTPTLHPILPTLTPTTSVVVVAVAPLLVVALRNDLYVYAE